MFKELPTLGYDDFDYFSLVRKNDNKEVYTSPCYLIDDTEVLDSRRIKAVFKFYFDRVNSEIERRKSQNPDDDKTKELKKLEPSDFVIKMKKHMPLGYAEHVYWTKEATDLLKN